MEDDDDDQNQESDRLQILTLALFDLYWFRSFVLLNLLPPPPSPPPPLPPPPLDAESSTSYPLPPPETLLRQINHQRRFRSRSLSDDLSPSPTLQIHPPKLQTILSGKESAIADEIPRFHRLRIGGESRSRRRRRQRRRESSSKSLSELEFEELKGFTDLGFTFSDAESDPRLMEIVPGLQRLKVAVEDGVVATAEEDGVAVARRAYLSEAWEEEEEENIPVRKLEIPIDGGGVDLRNRLKFWAQSVASTVR